MDMVVGLASGGLARLTLEQEVMLGGDRAVCPGKMNLGARGWRNGMEECLHPGAGDFKEKSFDFFLGFIYTQLLSKKVLQ